MIRGSCSSIICSRIAVRGMGSAMVRATRSEAAAVWAAMMSRSITPSVTVRSLGSKLTGTV